MHEDLTLDVIDRQVRSDKQDAVTSHVYYWHGQASDGNNVKCSLASVAGASPPVGGPNINSDAMQCLRRELARADRTLGIG